VFFVLIFGIFTFVLYGIGGGRGFTDRTQTMLLRVSENSGILLALFSGIAFFITILRVIHSPRFAAIMGLVLYFVLCVLGIFSVIFSGFIIAAAGGNV
jgi:hypothetical protein